MKNIPYRVNEGTRVTYWLKEGTTRTDPKVSGYNQVTVPNEINPGDRVNPTAWYYDISTQQCFMGKMHYQSDPTVGHYGSIYTGMGWIRKRTPWDRAALYNLALARLNSKAHERTDWSEDIFQFPQVRKLANPLRLASEIIADALGAGREKLPKRKPKLGTTGLGVSRKKPYAAGGLQSDSMSNLKTATKLAATMQLQTAFALKPLVNNIFDTASAMLQQGSETGVLIRGGAKQPIAEDYSTDNADIWMANGVKHTEKGQQGCRIYVYMTGQEGFNGLDWISLNPALWAWNALPYSFVIDWMYDVGGYLEQMENAFRYNGMFKSGYVNYLYANYIIERVDYGKDPYNNYVIEFARARWRKIIFEREILHAWPLPRMPRLNVDLGSGQLLSAAALLRNLLK